MFGLGPVDVLIGLGLPLALAALIFADARKLGMTGVSLWLLPILTLLLFPVPAIVYLGYRSGVKSQRRRLVTQ